MRTSRRLRRETAFVFAVVLGLFTGPTRTAEAGGRARSPRAWPAVILNDVIAHAAIESSLDGASAWLGSERCQSVIQEFHDRQGRPLADKLASLGVDMRAYLRLVHFVDGTNAPQCEAGFTLAFTTAGSRVVFVCSRIFAREWITSKDTGKAVVLHEALHSLGLGENPPTSLEITNRVLTLCGHR